jgi:hypothetical protein
MELDLQSFFGLHVYSCIHWLKHLNPPNPSIWAHIRWRYWSTKIDDISLCPLHLPQLFPNIFLASSLVKLSIILSLLAYVQYIRVHRPKKSLKGIYWKIPKLFFLSSYLGPTPLSPIPFSYHSITLTSILAFLLSVVQMYVNSVHRACLCNLMGERSGPNETKAKKNRKGFLPLHIFLPSTRSAVPQSGFLFVNSAKLKLVTLQQTQAGRYLPYPFFLYSSAFFAVEWSKNQSGALLPLLIAINATGGMKRIGIEYYFFISVYLFSSLWKFRSNTFPRSFA